MYNYIIQCTCTLVQRGIIPYSDQTMLLCVAVCSGGGGSDGTADAAHSSR